MSGVNNYRDTIFALSSGGQPSGVAVFRMSGPDVRFGLETMVGKLPESRKAVLAQICGPGGTVIDRGLVLFFPRPHSFTGEDCAEFQVHGGPAVIKTLLITLGRLNGFRSAEPGEFTKRAFENGKMDLTAVEGLADLIAAETETQRRMALDQASGSLNTLYGHWRKRLIHIRAMIEADLDFADEEDVPGSVIDSIWKDIDTLKNEIRNHLEGARSGEIIRDGYRVAIIGAPNAGKSSLLNSLARRDIAIVSDEAGTTRDVLEVHLDLDGYPVILYDTAGIRDDAGKVEQEGIRRAKAAAGSADLVIELREPGIDLGVLDSDTDADRHLIVGSKSDLNTTSIENDYDCMISVKTQQGLDTLVEILTKKVASSTISSVTALPNRQRHREYLERALEAMDEAIADKDLPTELRAEMLRLAGDMIGRLTGAIDTEDLLDVIFSEFCIGK